VCAYTHTHTQSTYIHTQTVCCGDSLCVYLAEGAHSPMDETRVIIKKGIANIYTHTHSVYIQRETETACRSDSLCKITNHPRLSPHNVSVNANAAGIQPTPPAGIHPTRPEISAGIHPTRVEISHFIAQTNLAPPRFCSGVWAPIITIHLLYLLLTCFTCC